MMAKGTMVPYDKISKRQKKEWDKQRRGSWGAICPVTRCPDNPRKYNRAKARRWKRKDDSFNVGFCLICQPSKSMVSPVLFS